MLRCQILIVFAAMLNVYDWVVCKGDIPASFRVDLSGLDVKARIWLSGFNMPDHCTAVQEHRFGNFSVLALAGTRGALAVRAGRE